MSKNKANYNYVYKLVSNVLLNVCSNKIPIDIDYILAQTNIKLIPYSKLSKDSRLPIRTCIKFLGSELGAYVVSGSNFIIYYNDTKNNKALERFTIAHELGHHFLKHSKHYDTQTLRRQGIPDEEYEELEKEANCFARNLLAPVCMLDILDLKCDTEKDKKKNMPLIASYFNISHIAAKVRASNYTIDHNRLPERSIKETIKKFQYSLYLYKYTRQCCHCREVAIIKNAKYCHYCGNPNLNRCNREIIETNYDGLETEIGKLKNCPICGDDELHIEDSCKICGTLLVNRCMNVVFEEQCKEAENNPLPGNAKYCPYCGSKTTFLINSLLKSYKEIQSEKEPQFELEELPF